MSPHLSILFVVVACLTAAQAATRCCLPSQWESILSQVGGVHVEDQTSASVFFNDIKYSYDAKNQRMAMLIKTSTKGTVSQSKVIQDFHTRKQYLIMGQHCTYTKLPAFKPACIPANATYMGRYYMGAGKSRMNIDSWRIPVAQLTMVLTITADGQCVPISELVYGQVGKVQELITMGFVNLTRGIVDPSVFRPPEGCVPAHDEDTLFFEKQNPVASKLAKYMSMRHSYQ